MKRPGLALIVFFTIAAAVSAVPRTYCFQIIADDQRGGAERQETANINFWISGDKKVKHFIKNPVAFPAGCELRIIDLNNNAGAPAAPDEDGQIFLAVEDAFGARITAPGYLTVNIAPLGGLPNNQFAFYLVRMKRSSALPEAPSLIRKVLTTTATTSTTLPAPRGITIRRFTTTTIEKPK